MTPQKAAIQLSKVWRASRAPGEALYPVDCRGIAEGLGIKVHGDTQLGNEFEAALFIESGLGKGAIIYNDNIREQGRKNFCIGHELGHFSVHKNRSDIYKCTISDLNDMQPHPQNIEQEANLFAVMLLMPADDFKIQLASKRPSLAAVASLTDRYGTSLTATTLRALELCSVPMGIVVVQNGRIKWWRRNDHMKPAGLWLIKGQDIRCKLGATDSGDGTLVDPSLWLGEAKAKEWELTQSNIHMSYYDQTIIMLTASSIGSGKNSDEMGDIDVVWDPKFH